jgi:lipid-binding SYLF domain-containing protein
MRKFIQRTGISLFSLMLVVSAMSLHPAFADTAAEIDRDVDSALQKLYASTPAAKELSKVAKGILVFPNVVKGGLIVGGQYGVGALREGRKTFGYYKTVRSSTSRRVLAGRSVWGRASSWLTRVLLAPSRPRLPRMTFMPSSSTRKG